MKPVSGKGVEAATTPPSHSGTISPLAEQGNEDQAAESAAQRRKSLLQSTARLEQTGQRLAKGKRQLAETEVLQCVLVCTNSCYIFDCSTSG